MCISWKYTLIHLLNVNWDLVCLRVFIKKLIFILFGVILSLNGFSIKPKPHIIDTSEIFNQIKKFNLDETRLSFSTTFFNSIVYKNDSTIFYNPNNTLYLFKIYLGDIPHVSMLSNQVQLGLTNNRHLFIYNDIIYSYWKHPIKHWKALISIFLKRI